MKNSCHQYQQGAAMIMFMLMLPVLVGFMFLTVDSGRFLRLKAQVADATEVASLAVSAYPMGADGWNDAEKKTREELARTYITALVPDLGGDSGSDRLSVAVGYKKCTGCDPLKSYAQFTLDVTTKHDAIFPAKTDDDFGFASQVTFGSQSISRKYNGAPVDLVLVADFSDSMNDRWNEEKKISMLKRVVGQVVTTIDDFYEDGEVKSTVSLVPFNTNTRNKKGGNICLIQQAITSDGELDVTSTVARLFEEKTECLEIDAYDDDDDDDDDGDGDGDGDGDNSYFYSISRPTNLIKITNRIKGMSADWGTASYEGIIRAAQIAKKGNNQRRLIIVLSDGKDSPYSTLIGFAPNEFHNQLLSTGKYCQKIRDVLNKSPNNGGVETESKIAVIGFDYNMDENENLKNCAGTEDNVYSAADDDALYDLIMGLIAEEIGHLYTLPDA